MNAQQYLTPTLSNANTPSFYPLHLPDFLVSFPRIKARKARQFVWWFLHDAPACATFETGRGVTSVLHIRSTLTVLHTVQLTIIIFLFPFQSYFSLFSLCFRVNKKWVTNLQSEGKIAAKQSCVIHSASLAAEPCLLVNYFLPSYYSLDLLCMQCELE